MAELRHEFFSQDAEVLVTQLAENARDTNAALDKRIAGRLVTVTQYSAAGSANRLALPISAGASPYAVLLVRAYSVSDPGASLPVTGAVNFTQSGNALSVPEPAGLTLNQAYTLTFLVLE